MTSIPPEQYFRAFYLEAPVVATSTNGQIAYITKVACEILNTGLKPKKLIGKSINLLIPSHLHKAHHSKFNKLESISSTFHSTHLLKYSIPIEKNGIFSLVEMTLNHLNLPPNQNFVIGTLTPTTTQPLNIEYDSHHLIRNLLQATNDTHSYLGQTLDTILKTTDENELKTLLHKAKTTLASAQGNAEVICYLLQQQINPEDIDKQTIPLLITTESLETTFCRAISMAEWYRKNHSSVELDYDTSKWASTSTLDHRRLTITLFNVLLSSFQNFETGTIRITPRIKASILTIRFSFQPQSNEPASSPQNSVSLSNFSRRPSSSLLQMRHLMEGSKILTQQMGGEVTVTSKTGTIRIKVPLQSSQISTALLAPTSSPKSFDNKIGTILIVEDELINRMLLQRNLEAYNLQVITAKNGIEALKKLEKHAPQMILSDISMPHMDGNKFAKKLKADHCTIPIYAITATPSDVDPKAGFKEVFSKPYRIKEHIFPSLQTIFPEIKPLK